MLEPLLLFIAGTITVLAGIPAIVLASRSVSTGLTMLGILLLAAEFFQLPEVDLGEVTVGPLEIVSTSLLMIGVGRLLSGHGRPFLGGAYVLVSALAFGLVRGLGGGDAASALGFTEDLSVVAGIIYGSSFRLTWLGGKSLYSRVALLALAICLAQVALQLELASGTGEGHAITATAALIVAQGLVVLLLVTLRLRVPWLCTKVAAVIVFSLTLLISQQRTVWVATIVGLLYIMYAWPRQSIRLLGPVVAAVVAVATVNMSGATGGREVFERADLITSVEAATQDHGSMEWRMERWKSTLETHFARGPVAVATGAGYGASWVEFGAQVERTENPHNQWVEVVVRFGVLGALAGLAAWLVLLRRLRTQARRLSGTEGLVADSLLAVLVMQGVFMVTYSISGLQALLIGLAVGSANSASVSCRRRGAGVLGRDCSYRRFRPGLGPRRVDVYRRDR